MTGAVLPEERERDCDTPGTVMESQLKGLAEALMARGFISRSEQGQYVYDALAFTGIGWRHEGKLEKLSCRQAGLVLKALYFGPEVPHEH